MRVQEFLPIFVDVNQVDEIDHRVQGDMEYFGSSSQREGGGDSICLHY